MIDAKLLATYADDAAGALDVWSVWIPRKGDNVVIAMEVVANYGTDMTVDLWEKNYDEVGDGEAAGLGFAYAGDTGVQYAEDLGVKELVRFRFKLTRNKDLDERDIGLILFRVLQPVWFETVKV